MTTVTPQYFTNCEMRTVDLTNGEQDYIWVDFEDRLQQNIQAVTVQIAMGTYETPGTWYPADLVEENGAVYKIRAGLFVGGALTFPLGIYYAWIKVGDSPAIIVQRVDARLVQFT